MIDSRADTDPYAFWHELLAADKKDEAFRSMVIGEPCAGFWRVRYGANMDFVPFATFPRDGRMVGVLFGREIDPAEFWPSYVRHPISESVYRAVAETGTDWPRDPRKELSNV